MNEIIHARLEMECVFDAYARAYMQKLKRQLIIACVRVMLSQVGRANENQPNPTHEGGWRMYRVCLGNWQKVVLRGALSLQKLLPQKVSQ